MQIRVNKRQKNSGNLAKWMLKNKQGFLINFLIIYTLQNVKGFSLLPGMIILPMLISIKILFDLVVIMAQLAKAKNWTIFKEKLLSITHPVSTLRTIESRWLALPPH